MILARIDLTDSDGDLFLVLFAHGRDGAVLPPGIWRAVAREEDGTEREVTVDIETLPDYIRDIVAAGSDAIRDLEREGGPK